MRQAPLFRNADIIDYPIAHQMAMGGRMFRKEKEGKKERQREREGPGHPADAAVSLRPLFAYGVGFALAVV